MVVKPAGGLQNTSDVSIGINMEVFIMKFYKLAQQLIIVSDVIA